VPLQRLFLREQRFHAAAGELLAKRVAAKATTADRIQKSYG
jgi:hypothetical protein